MNNSLALESAAVSDRGLSDKRPQNEDSFIAMPDLGIFAVADGVGGAQAGDVASQMAVEILGEAFSHRVNGDAEEVMKLAIQRANSAIFQMASELPQLASMATTIVAVHVAGDVATIGHVGDSRLYRFDPSGTVFRETNDHSVVEEEVRAGRMTPEEAAHHPNKNIISRALGAEGSVDIDLKTIMAGKGTTFLLCSDGITRHIEDPELREIFASGESPDSICQRLKTICYSRGAEDNLTAVVVRLGDGFHRTLETEERPENEEVTVAAARQAAAADDFGGEIDGPDLESTISDEPYPTAAAEGDSRLMIEPTASAPSEQAEANAPAAVPAEVSTMAAVPSYTTGDLQQTEASGGGRLILPLLMLIIGAAVGAGTFYLFFRPEPLPAVQPTQPPTITEMKSTNTALTAFEESRRQADSDPAKYLAANATSPQDAEDYFLLGRAYLLTGEFWQAKQNFNQAKSMLPTVEPNNARTLAAEIALGLAVIESPSASQSFTKNFINNRAGGNTATNANVPANR